MFTYSGVAFWIIFNLIGLIGIALFNKKYDNDLFADEEIIGFMIGYLIATPLIYVTIVFASITEHKQIISRLKQYLSIRKKLKPQTNTNKTIIQQYHQDSYHILKEIAPLFQLNQFLNQFELGLDNAEFIKRIITCCEKQIAPETLFNVNYINETLKQICQIKSMIGSVTNKRAMELLKDSTEWQGKQNDNELLFYKETYPQVQQFINTLLKIGVNMALDTLHNKDSISMAITKILCNQSMANLSLLNQRTNELYNITQRAPELSNTLVDRLQNHLNDVFQNVTEETYESVESVVKALQSHIDTLIYMSISNQLHHINNQTQLNHSLATTEITQPLNQTINLTITMSG